MALRRGGSARVLSQKMTLRRGRSARVLVVAILLFSVLQCALIVEGATYIVGDGQGWSFQIQSSGWTAGKKFQVGDILVFNYWPPFHNVVAVDARGYNSCRAGRSKPLISGNDTITVKKGINYFICSIPLHCSLGGMKLAITAD